MPRNIANKLLMRNAQRVEDYKLDPDMLEWKNLIGIDDVPTLPELPTCADEPTVIVHVSPDMYRLDEDPDPEAA